MMEVCKLYGIFGALRNSGPNEWDGERYLGTPALEANLAAPGHMHRRHLPLQIQPTIELFSRHPFTDATCRLWTSAKYLVHLKIHVGLSS